MHNPPEPDAVPDQLPHRTQRTAPAADAAQGGGEAPGQPGDQGASADATVGGSSDIGAVGDNQSEREERDGDGGVEWFRDKSGAMVGISIGAVDMLRLANSRTCCYPSTTGTYSGIPYSIY